MIQLLERLRARPACRPCAAIRAAVHSSLASTHDSFNASALGAFVESPLHARGEEPSASTYLEVYVRYLSGDVTVRFWEHDDTSSDMGGLSSTSYKAVGYNAFGVAIWEAQNKSGSPSFSSASSFNCQFGSANIVAYPTTEGYTVHEWDTTTGTAPTADEVFITRLKVVLVSTGEVVRDFQDLTPIVADSIVNPSTNENYYMEPWCCHGPFDNGVNCAALGRDESIALRWRYQDLGGGNYVIYVDIHTLAAHSPGVATCQTWNGGTNFIKITFTDTGGGEQTVTNSSGGGLGNGLSNEFWPTPLCSGGSYGGQGSTGDDDNALLSSNPGWGGLAIGWEPATITEIENLTGGADPFIVTGSPVPYEIVNGPIA